MFFVVVVVIHFGSPNLPPKNRKMVHYSAVPAGFLRGSPKSFNLSGAFATVLLFVFLVILGYSHEWTERTDPARVFLWKKQTLLKIPCSKLQGMRSLSRFRSTAMRTRRFACAKIVPLLFGIFLCLPSCATNPVTGRQELMLLSEGDEIGLGRRTDAQISRTYGLYKAPDLEAYIQRLGKRVAMGSHRPNLPFDFKVLDSPVVNAFAVPGGFIYVSRGILGYMSSEAELAGVIGHEIGHVAARHSAQQYSRAQLAQLGLGVGSILSTSFRQYAQVAQFGVEMLFLRFSRDNERQADDLGVEYATKAGFDASRMANFFNTLERMHPSSDRSGLPGWFSTHPNPPDRIRAIQQRARQWRERLGRPNLLENRHEYLHRIEGLVFGEDPRQGYVSDHLFFHPDLKFQFPVPVDWKLNNTPAQVQIYSKKQDAVILLSGASGSSPKAVARKFIADSQAVVLGFDTISVNGLRAQRVLSDMTTQQGAIRVLSYFIEKDTTIYVFHAFSSPSLFGQYAPVFKTTLEGFKPLSDPKKINVEPDRIRIRSARASGTLEGILRSLGVEDDKLKETALLNGKYLHDTIPAGTLLKVVKKGK